MIVHVELDVWVRCPHCNDLYGVLEEQPKTPMCGNTARLNAGVSPKSAISYARMTISYLANELHHSGENHLPNAAGT
jgi:hypothetical protein